MTKSAYSMESASFQDHPDLHGEKTDNLHGESANLHGQRGDLHGTPNGTQFFKQSFSTISRSKSVASISNDTDPEGKTKILTMLQLKLPHHSSTDDVTVKVDNGAEGNILPLNSFRAMFSHALDANGYPKAGFLRGSKTMLECYDDGKLVNHGSIKLKLQHYSEKSFQDHSGNPHGNKKSGKSVLSRPSTKCVKSEPKSSNYKAIEPQNMHKKGSFKTIEDGSKKDTSFKTIVNRVNNLNP